jgi:hypothetical protein
VIDLDSQDGFERFKEQCDVKKWSKNQILEKGVPDEFYPVFGLK